MGSKVAVQVSILKSLNSGQSGSVTYAARLTNCTMYSPRAAASAPGRKDFAKALLFSTGAISTAVAKEEKMI